LPANVSGRRFEKTGMKIFNTLSVMLFNTSVFYKKGKNFKRKCNTDYRFIGVQFRLSTHGSIFILIGIFCPEFTSGNHFNSDKSGTIAIRTGGLS